MLNHLSYFFLRWSQIVTKEVSFQLSFELVIYIYIYI